MNVPRMAAAFGCIDDDLVEEALNDRIPVQPILILWIRRAALVCLCALLLVPIAGSLYAMSFGSNSVSPYEKTHSFFTSQLSEIEGKCGTDLLLDRIPVSGSRSVLYHLELTEAGKNFEDPGDWKYLYIKVRNSDSVFDADWDDLSCYISFDGSYEANLRDFEHTTVDDFENTVVVDINGYTVAYAQLCSEETAELQAAYTQYGGSYHGWAKFVHQGYTYYIAVHSNDPQYLETVLNSMLGA